MFALLKLLRGMLTMSESKKKWGGRGLVAAILAALIIFSPNLLSLGDMRWAPALSNERDHQKIKESLRAEVKEQLDKIRADTKETRADIGKIKESLAGIQALLSTGRKIKYGSLESDATRASESPAEASP